MAKIPATAFACYLALGPNRSYEALAQKYGCSKKAITRHGTKEHWQERLAEVEENARKATAAKAGESLSALHDRHRRMVRMVQARAIEKLKDTPLRTAMDAVRALAIALREERELVSLDDTDRDVDDVDEGDLATLKAVLTAQYPFVANLIASSETMDSVRSWGRAIRGYERAWLAEDPTRTQEAFRGGDHAVALLEWISRAADGDDGWANSDQPGSDEADAGSDSSGAD